MDKESIVYINQKLRNQNVILLYMAQNQNSLKYVLEPVFGTFETNLMMQLLYYKYKEITSPFRQS